MKKIIGFILVIMMLFSTSVAYASNPKAIRISYSGVSALEKQLKEIEKQLKKYHELENERNRIINQLSDLKKRITQLDKRYYSKLTVYLNGTEYIGNKASSITYGNISIPGGLIDKGLGAEVKYSNRIMTVTKGTVKIFVNFNNRKILLNGDNKVQNLSTGANASIRLIKLIAEYLGYKVNVKENEGIIIIEGASNLAALKAASTDSFQAGNGAEKGNDANLNSRWCAGDSGVNHWWKVDLGSSYSLSGTEIKWEFATKYRYKIEVSADNSSWSLLVDKTNSSSYEQIQKDSFQAQSVRFIRVTVTGLEQGCWASFYDFKAFGAAQVYDTIAPTTPAALSATAQSTSQINLSWTASTDNVGVAGYKLYRNNTQIATITSGTSCSDTGLTPGTTYYYSVSAYDAQGNSSQLCPAITAATYLNVGSGNGLRGEYFNNKNLTNLIQTRIDPQINFNWGKGSPFTNIDADTFSVRWSGQVLPLYSQEYTFSTVSDDGVVLYVNGNRIINKWKDQSQTENSGKIYLNAGQKVDIRLEYYENTVDSVIKLYWSSQSQSKEIIPQNQLFCDISDNQAPTVPAGLTATPASSSSINLSWLPSTDNVGVSGYKVLRNGVQIGTAINSTTYTDTGLQAGSTYVYSVLSYDVQGNISAQCGLVPATTPSAADTVPPSIPTGLIAQAVYSSQINLNWAASTDNTGVTGYKIYRGGILISTVNNATVFIDSGLNGNTSYTYQVSAFDKAGNISHASAAVTVKTPEGADTLAPTVPQGLTGIAISAAQISLNWSPSTDNKAVTGYKLYRGGVQLGTITNGTAYLDSNLTQNTSYSYTVSAFDAAGNTSAQCNPFTLSTPAIVSNGNGLLGEYFDNNDLTALKLSRIDSKIDYNWGTGSPDTTIGNETFSVRWTGQVAPLFSEEYTFNIVSDDGVRLWVNGTKLIDNWNEHSNSSNDGKIKLTAGQKYDIRLEYFENTGDSTIKLSWSSPSQAKQIIPQSQLFGVADTHAPTIPAGLNGTAASTTQINLSWTPSTDNIGVLGYKVFRGGTQVATVTNATSYNDTGLTVNTSYSYSVYAYDAQGNCSEKCPAVTVSTKAQAITSVNDSVTGTGDNQFNYSSNWSYGSQSGAYQNDNHWSSTADAFYQIQFTGTQIKLYGAMDTSHGIARILIDDNVAATVDFYAAARADNALLFTSQPLSRGQHKLKVVVTGTKNTKSSNYHITADRVEIIDG